MSDHTLMASYGIPIGCFVIHMAVVLGKVIWRKRQRLTSTLWPEVIGVAGFWFTLWAAVALYFSQRFHHYSLNLDSSELVLSFYPQKEKRIPFDDIDEVRVIRSRRSGKVFQRAWQVEVSLESGQVYKSLQAPAENFSRWSEDRFTRKDLLALKNIVE